MSNKPRSERIFEMSEQGMPNAEIAAFFRTDLDDIHRNLYRVRKRRRLAAARAAETAGAQ